MDNIKNLISLTYANGLDNEKHLKEAFRLLNGIISKRNINECFEQATEMCVILSESCLKNDIKSIANDCIKLYFSMDPQENQYLARAYLTQAQLIHPQRFDDETALDKPIGFVMKAINFSKKEKRFHYLVYNSSLVYYDVIRNYLRRNYYQYLCKSLSLVCKALEDINDSNMAWRSQLMLLLIQCHIDAGHKKEIIQIVDGTATFIGRHAPSLLKELLTTLITNGIGTMEKYLWYTKNHITMQMFIRLSKLKIMKDKEIDGSSLMESKKILSILIGIEDNSVTTSTESINMKSDSKNTPPVPFNSKKLTNEQRCSLLLELAKITLQKSILDVCRQSINKIQQISTEEMSLIILESEFIESELIMMESDLFDEKITPTTLKLRLTMIEKCHSTLLNVIRKDNNKLVELGCATLWNLCLPILQPNFIKKINNYLVLIADSLESIGCLNYKLSAQVHIEVAKGYGLLEQSNDALKYFKLALLLDRTGEYKELIEHFINKIKMQEKLYEKPTDPCDLARQLLEQVKTTINNEKIPLEKLRPLLAQIGHYLAPDDFLVILDHDLSIEESNNETNIHDKATRTTTWENITTRLSSYLKRLGNNDDRIKLTLWVDLVKLSRKIQLWDICRVSSCFAILYDDGRWKNQFQIKQDNLSRKGKISNLPTPENSSLTLDPASDVDNNDSNENKIKKREESDISSISLVKKNRYEKMLLEQIVEMYFIRAEAFIQAIRYEGAQLFTLPERPKDFKKHPKGFVKDTTKEDEDWQRYCDCLSRLSNSIVDCFTRAAAISIDLQAPWLTQNAATYLWNYSIHIIILSDHLILVPHFQIMFDYLRLMINDKMVDLITQIGVVLAHGLIQKLMPMPYFSLENIFETKIQSNIIDKKTKKDRESPKNKSIPVAITNHVDSVAQYKKALDICQYLMDITSDPVLPPSETSTPNNNNNNNNINNINNNNNNNNTNKTVSINKIVDMKTKCRLIDIWVQCKQLLQQNIGKTLGTDDLDSKVGQRANVRVTTAVQMIWISQNEFYKFPDLPSIEDCLQMTDECEWEQSTILMTVLLKLCHYVMRTTVPNSSNILVKIADKAIEICPQTKVAIINNGSKNNANLDERSEEKLAVSYILFCEGVNIHKTSSQSTVILLKCLRLFVKACCYARDARNYYMVSQIAHYFWKISQCLIERFSNTSQIAKEIEIIVNCLVMTINKRRLKLFFESHTEEEELKIAAELEEKLPHILQCPTDHKLISIEQSKALFQTCYRPQLSKSGLEQDLKLLIQMQIAVFQSYSFQEKWVEALKTLDEAISDLPRTHHRLELFRHRLLTKVRLGQSIELDIQKFKNEKEEEIANIWREIALRSKTMESQLFAYKKSIEVLQTKENDWLKVDLILELSQWMFHCNFPGEICCQYLDYAIDILLNMEIVKKNVSHPTSSIKSKSQSNSRKAISAVKTKGKSEVRQIEIIETNNQPNGEISMVPQTNKNFIGVHLLPARPTTIDAITDIRVLSNLMITLICKTKLLNQGTEVYQSTIILASSCVVRMWQIAMTNLNSAVKEISKSKIDVESPTKSKDKKEKTSKSSKIEPEPVKSKVPKRKGPLDWLPSNHEEWSLYEVSDDIIEALTSPKYMSYYGFHDLTINHMGQFMNSCDILIDLLEEINHEILAFPILSFMDAISRSEEIAPAKLLNQYIHIRALQISIRNNMATAISHHEKFIEIPFVLPEYMAYADIIKANIEEYKKQNKTSTLPMNFENQSTIPIEVVHLKRKERKFGYLHETWIKMGKKLIDMGYNKEASDVIFAAEGLTDVLKDNEMMSNIKILKAVLLKNQGEFEESLRYIDDLENNCSKFTIEQWLAIVDLFIGIAMSDISQYRDICTLRIRMQRILEHTKTRIPHMKLSNEKRKIDNLTLRMEFGLVLFDKRLAIMNLGDNICWENCNEIFNGFLDRLNEMENINQKDINLKSLLEIVRTKLEVYDLLIKMADERNSKILILKKLSCIENIIFIQQYYNDVIHNNCYQSQNSSFNLVVDRQMARSKLVLVDCLLFIYSYEVSKSVKLYLEHQQKDPLKQIVDEYIAEVIPDKESQEWRFAATGVCDKICCQLNDVHILCSKIPDINAQCLMKYGHVMKLRSMEINPNENYQWSNVSINLSSVFKPSTQVEIISETNNIETERSDDIEIMPLEDYSKLIKMSKTKKAIIQSREYLFQSIEMLNQSICISINNQYYDTCCYAIELLMDIVGQFDNQQSVQLLCLHQSCRSSVTMRYLLLTTLHQASIGQLAALALQYHFLVHQTKFNDANLTESPLYRSVVERLNSNFLAWKMTNVSINQSDLIKDLSSITSGFYILEHSISDDHLYGAFVDSKQKPSNPGKAVVKSLNDKSKIYRIKITKSQLLTLKQEWYQFKRQLDNLVYDIEIKNEIIAKQTNLYSQIENENEMIKAINKKEGIDNEVKLRIAKMETEFNGLMYNLQQYLHPILEYFNNLMVSELERGNSNNQKNSKESISQSKECTILLTDEILAGTSLEMINEFKSVISRDFSLQVMHNRFKGFSGNEIVDPAQIPDANKKKEKSKTIHRIPALREVNKKPAKNVPLNRQISPGSILIDTHQIRYIIDPHIDTEYLGSLFKKEMTNASGSREQQITPRWIGLVGIDDNPSISEIELYLKDASTLLYVNTENLTSLLTPQRITMLNTNELQLLCCFDRMINRRTKDRIVQRGSTINSLDIPNQDSVATAQLISLMGVRSLVCNQWSTLFDWANRTISQFMSNFLDDGLSLGETVQKIRKTFEDINNESQEQNNDSNIVASFITNNTIVYGLPNLVLSGSP